ncbi:hypothetical protein ACLB1G_21205 [Oxalobacteraceae bacterium A2-2]
MIKYADLGAHKQLNEIVFAGSHDAGITGDDNAQTQALDTGGQAGAGVRFFDLRIAAFRTNNVAHGVKQTEMKAFHADGKLHVKEDKVRGVAGLPGAANIERSRLRAGAEGLPLQAMLQDVRDFVTSADFGGGFLILKFDKCTNWGLIPKLCRSVLGNMLYTAGGTSAMNGKSHHSKIKENVKKQARILAAATTGVQVKTHLRFARSLMYSNALANPNILGMMYWTSDEI